MSITVCIPKGSESYDAEKNEFYTVERDIFITMEHSLISMQKWEQKWHIPYLVSKPKKTTDQMYDYLRCMVISKDIDADLLKMLPASEIKRIEEYINDPMTATTFKEIKQPPTRPRIKTAEELYSDMIILGIPFECRKWHLNSLVTLIRVCNDRQNPRQKMSRKESGKWMSEMNKLRKKAWNTKG